MKKIVRLTENDLMRLVKRVIKEQQSSKFDKNYFAAKKQGTFTLDNYGIPSSIDGVNINDFNDEVQQYFDTFEIGGRGTQAGQYVWKYSNQAGEITKPFETATCWTYPVWAWHSKVSTMAWRVG